MYNTNLYKIASQLFLCAEQIDNALMIKENLSTFHATFIVLARQNQNMHYVMYFDLILILWLMKKNKNNLLSQNHGEWPVGLLLMQSHASHMSTTRFTCQGYRKRMKLKNKNQTPTCQKYRRACKYHIPIIFIKWPFFRAFANMIIFARYNYKISNLFQMWNQRSILQDNPYLVKIYTMYMVSDITPISHMWSTQRHHITKWLHTQLKIWNLVPPLLALSLIIRGVGVT